MQTLKTVDDFIRFYEAIPDDKWCVGAFNKRYDDGVLRHCAIGHLVAGSGNADTLRRLWDFSKSGPVEYVNDGKGMYLHFGKTPKARILNALNKIKDCKKVNS